VRYLLDTNMASYVIRGNFLRVRQKLVRPMAEVGISVITEAELRSGVARKPGALRLAETVEKFLVRVEILPWDSPVAEFYASLRATIGDAGAPMGNLDMMIAAQALAAEAITVTRDRVFHRVKQIENRGLDQNLTAGRVRLLSCSYSIPRRRDGRANPRINRPIDTPIRNPLTISIWPPCTQCRTPMLIARANKPAAVKSKLLRRIILPSKIRLRLPAARRRTCGTPTFAGNV
jgi:tRNA(fMet)-specific endonuclease VapC